MRWFGRADARSDWQRITATTPGSFGEIVACLLLADRNGAASRAQIDTFIRVVGDIVEPHDAAVDRHGVFRLLRGARRSASVWKDGVNG